MDSYFIHKMKDGRFLRKIVKRSSGCWEWSGGCNSDGYGCCAVRYPEGGKIITQLSHRVAWCIFIGQIPEGMCVCHSCDNTRCVNPDHLFLGTHKDNMKDRNSKGRAAGGDGKGELNSNCKLNTVKVISIRTKHSTGDSMSKLARKYGVSVSTVSNIIHKKSWGHV